MLNLDKIFPIKFFSDSDVNNILKTEEQKILVLYKDKKNTSLYSTFNDDFSTYLSKLPNNNVKQQNQNLMNKDLVFLSVAKIKPDNIFVRILTTIENKLAGIVLDTQQLDIDPITGSTDSIDNCVYATYFGLVRSAVLLNKDEIRQDKDLHKLLTTYLHLLLIKAIGIDKIYSQKSKNFIHILAIYIYYKYYLKEKHSYILTIIERDYESFIGKDDIAEFMPMLEKMQGYNSIKDFPKMLIDAKIWNESPNIIIVSLLKMLKPIGFYCLIGPLDYLISLAVVSRYPTDFFSKKCLVSDKIQETIEKIMIGYIDKIKFDLSAVPKS